MNPPTGHSPYSPQGASTGEAPGALRFRPGPGGSDGRDDEAALLRRMAAGDEAALGALYDRSYAILYGLVLRVVGDADDAEEVLEETFWQAWRQAGRYEEGRGSVGSWLATIARSRALDRLRARRRIREEQYDELPEPAYDGGQPETLDPLGEAQASETRTLVRAALLKLPVEQREALELAYFGGLSQSEISERTGQPLGTVKTRMRLAMQKLKEGLAVLREGAR